MFNANKWLLTANKYKRSTATEIYLAAVYNTNYHKIKDFLRTHQTIRFMPPPLLKKTKMVSMNECTYPGYFGVKLFSIFLITKL